jgi:sugar-specific transcriptional regulator TrmB
MNRIDFFEDLGFGEYESKILSSLVKLGIASAKEVSLDSGVPQNKLYGVFEEFEKKGLLAKIPSDVKKYQLINLKSFIDSKLKERENRLKELRVTSKKIEEAPVEENFNFSLIKGQKAVMSKLAESNEKVEKEILGVQRNWKIWGEGLRAMESAVRRGVVVKQIGVINDETLKRANEWKKTGVKIRKYNDKFGQFPLRFSIFDRKYARITIGKPEIPNPEDYLTIWTDSKPLINMLLNQFNEMWKECENF